MQRKKIKLGETYAVVKRTGKHDGGEKNSVGAKVVELDVQYETARWGAGSWSSRTVRMADGIRVEFTEPVIEGHYTFTALSTFDPEDWTDEVNEARRKDAITETVLEGSRLVIRPWAEVVEMRERWARERDERKAKIDAAADAVEPVYEAVVAALGENKCEVKSYKGDGVNGKRIIDATFTFNLDDLAVLLGVSVEP